MFISKRKHEPAHYMLKIESFSLLSEAKKSKIEFDVFEASGHKWRLDLYPIYVSICDTESRSKGRKVCVDVCFFVYDHINRSYVTFQDGNGQRTRFHEKKKTWGFDKLISFESFMDSKNGYLLNDSCVFGAEVFAVPEFTQIDRCLIMTKPPATMNTYTWTINNFSDITEDVLYSDAFKVGKVKWYTINLSPFFITLDFRQSCFLISDAFQFLDSRKLSLYPKGNKSSEGTHLSVFLCVYDDALLPKGWKVYAKFKLRLKSQSAESDIEQGKQYFPFSV
ncbi:uncharacterized protein LOC143593495 [Bidens hawaiensis]|uniref:uncharacterized protein LOC143593495 n=1 Tax=Bidens hawaiensis TaxID=980011 RepID=UPI004049F21E